MKFASPTNKSASAFTLIEVLAAMLFMAIVIPVAVEALHIAALSGEFATRKAEAARVADKVLNENLASTNGFSSLLEGTVVENGHQFRWRVETEPWSQDSAMELMTAEVSFSAGGRECSVRLNTLANPQVNLPSAGATTTGLP